jgi:hypothetical protein
VERATSITPVIPRGCGKIHVLWKKERVATHRRRLLFPDYKVLARLRDPGGQGRDLSWIYGIFPEEAGLAERNPTAYSIKIIP